MTAIVPVLLDARPPYLGEADGGSLLLLPTGRGTVLAEVAASVAAVTQYAPLVLPQFEVGPRYAAAVRRELPRLGGFVGLEIFGDPLARVDPTDLLLLVSPECYPADGLDLRPLVGARGHGFRSLRHLMAFDAASLGTREFVQPGEDGRPRRVQRYFEPLTWAFPAGLMASLVPVACVLAAADARFTHLGALRATMAARGVPSEDVPYRGRLVDLGDEGGALTLAEHRVARVVDAAEAAGAARAGAAAGPVVLGTGAVLDPTARFVGPVVVGEGARVDAGALVVGPALVGRGAHVGARATVAQCLVAEGGRVAEGVTVRHRVLGGAAPALGAPAAARGTGALRRQARGAAAPTSAPVRGRAYPVAKAAVEPVLAALLLLLLLPLLAVLAVLVLIDSGRPVFYGDRREGRDGVPFRCWKFRSMRTDAAALQRELMAAQEVDGPQFKMERDPRVTRVGHWLRKLNLDELPQLWNVLRGEMSFVGPRPSPFRENQICVPWRHGRLSVRPGITGLWQVCRRDRAAGDFHQWIHYDLLYVRHASAAVDLRVLLATVLTGGGRRPVRLEQVIPDAQGHTPLAGVPDEVGAWWTPAWARRPSARARAARAGREG